MDVDAGLRGWPRIEGLAEPGLLKIRFFFLHCDQTLGKTTFIVTAPFGANQGRKFVKYIASVRVGQNDVKALTQLEDFRRERFAPILDMRGKDERHLSTFLTNWGEHPFFIDISSSKADIKDPFLVNNGLLDPANAYKSRRVFFEDIGGEHNNMIPVVSWDSAHHSRDTTQFALRLDQNFKRIALRPRLSKKGGSQQWARTKSILNAVSDLSKVWIMLDIGPIKNRLDIADGELVTTALDWLRDLDLAGVVILSNSFPQDKPASGTTRTVPCLDVIAQSLANIEDFVSPVIYGDYASTNTEGVIEYVPGMPVVPFFSYFTNGEWWQTRRGGDKEFSKYVEIAKDVIRIPGYHGDTFCWATTEIARIAANQGGNGHNGSWNAIRINQHICAMLEFLDAVGFPVDVDSDDFFDDEEL